MRIEVKSNKVLLILSLAISVLVIAIAVWLFLGLWISNNADPLLMFMLPTPMLLVGVYSVYHNLYLYPDIVIEDDTITLDFLIAKKQYNIQDVTNIKVGILHCVIGIRKLPLANRVAGKLWFGTPIIYLTRFSSNYQDTVNVLQRHHDHEKKKKR
ncbi:MAG: hypothetical protein AAFR81_10795 [Chloroflexota bacterium]